MEELRPDLLPPADTSTTPEEDGDAGVGGNSHTVMNGNVASYSDATATPAAQKALKSMKQQTSARGAGSHSSSKTADAPLKMVHDCASGAGGGKIGPGRPTGVSAAGSGSSSGGSCNSSTVNGSVGHTVAAATAVVNDHRTPPSTANTSSLVSVDLSDSSDGTNSVNTSSSGNSLESNSIINTDNKNCSLKNKAHGEYDNKGYEGGF